jgi:hypothetical protein
MLPDQKFGPFSYRIWWRLFFVTKIAIASIMIGSLTTSRWVQTANDLFYANSGPNYGNRSFNGQHFAGSLYLCTDDNGCSGSFGNNAKDWCNLYNDLHGSEGNTPRVYTIESICVQFAVLFYGGGVFFVLEIIAIASGIVWSIAMFMITRQQNCFCLSFCCSGCVWVSHYVGALFFLGFSRTQYRDNCYDVPTNGDRPILCAKDGPGLILLNLLLVPIVVIAFCVVGCARQRAQSKGMSPAQGPANPPVYAPQNPQYPPQYEPQGGVPPPYPGALNITTDGNQAYLPKA